MALLDKELGRWNTDAFGEYVVGFNVTSVTTYVGEVGYGPHEGNRLSPVKYGCQKDVIRQMAGADPRIVGAKHIAILQGFQGMGLQ